jgi:hypothetical protein
LWAPPDTQGATIARPKDNPFLRAAVIEHLELAETSLCDRHAHQGLLVEHRPAAGDERFRRGGRIFLAEQFD